MAYQYQVSYGSSSSGPFTTYETVSAVTDTVTGLAAGTAYFFRVITIDTTTGVQSQPVVVGPFSTTAAITESPSGAVVNASTQTIRSAQTVGATAPEGGPYDTWSITGNLGSVVHNTQTDPNTSNIISLYYNNHLVYQQANATNELGINPGWWQWTGPGTGSNGWTASQDPRPTAPTITLVPVGSVALNVPFSVSGLLQNFTAAPTLQYADNAGTFVALPSGASVTTTTFSFTHPGIATTSTSFTIAVRDTAGHSVTSNTFSASNPAITNILLSNSSFPANATPGVGFGTLSAVMQGPAFSGTFSVSGSQFQIVSGNQLAPATNLAAGSYTANVTATQLNAGGSPFPKSFPLTATAGASIGPAATGTFVVADFTNKSSALLKYVWGVAEGQTGDNGFAGVADTNLQTAWRNLAYPLFRWNSQGTFLEKAFPGGATTATQTQLSQAFDNLINNFPRFAPADCRLIIGYGFPPTNWSSASNFAAACSVATNYFKTKTSSATGNPIPIYGFEVGNENNLSPGGVPSWYNSYFTSAASAIKAVMPNAKMFGPVSNYADDLNTFGPVGAACDVLDYHAYLYGGQGEFDSKGGQTAVLTNNLLNGLNNDLNSFVNGGGRSSVEIFIGEYNQNNTYGTRTGGQSPGVCNTFMQNASGAVFNANCVLAGINASPNFTMAGIWAGFQNSDYGIVGGSDNVNSGGYTACPGGFFLSKAAATMFGTRCNVTGLPGGVTALATTGGAAANAFGLMLINSSTSASPGGQIALSHWPVNSSGNGTINRWEVSNNNTQGVVTQLTVTAGVVQSTTIPPVSVVILYP